MNSTLLPKGYAVTAKVMLQEAKAYIVTAEKFEKKAKKYKRSADLTMIVSVVLFVLSLIARFAEGGGV